jgi:glycosyltransferase involved in cell wall biosynthesis
MRVTVFAEYRCGLNAQGEVCALNGPGTYPFWQRYHEVFSEVTVAARFSPETITGNRVTGPGVSFWPMPTYYGAAEYLRVRRELVRSVHAAARGDSAFILRVPSRFGVLAARTLRRMGKPYGIEVVGDPYDVFGPGGMHHPLRPFLRHRLAADLRKVARHAAVALYVTDEALQRRYPCPSAMIAVSDVYLSGGALAETWKRPRPGATNFRVVSVGSLAQPYKGQDVLLDAAARCLGHGFDITLVFVGDGMYRPRLEARAQEMGIAERVFFRGRLPVGAAVRAELDQADLFVMASRAEGLPRALVEAMGRGLPCLASAWVASRVASRGRPARPR